MTIKKITTKIANWWKQAQKDLDSTKKNVKIDRSHLVAFLCRHGVDKAPKFSTLVEKKELIKIQSLIRLVRFNNLPEKLVQKIKELEPIYRKTRCLDILTSVPFEKFKERSTTHLLEMVEEV